MTSERTIEIIDLDNNRPIVQIPSVDQDVIRYRLSPNGEFLIVGYDNGTIRLWQIATAVMLDVYAAGADIVDVGGWDSHSVSVLTREGMVLERFPTLEFEKPLSTPPHLLGDNPRERIERIIGQRTLTDDERHKYLD
jgi:WD40 repeat protein